MARNGKSVAPIFSPFTILKSTWTAGARNLAQLGEDYGGGLYEAEIEYLTNQEWAQTAQDILWRRSKLGLHVAPETAQRLAARLAR